MARKVRHVLHLLPRDSGFLRSSWASKTGPGVRGSPALRQALLGLPTELCSLPRPHTLVSCILGGPCHPGGCVSLGTGWLWVVLALWGVCGLLT